MSASIGGSIRGLWRLLAGVRDKNKDASRADIRSNQQRFTKMSYRQLINKELKFNYSIVSGFKLFLAYKYGTA